MIIEVQCKACMGTLEAPESAAGRLSKCPQCREPVQIPTLDEYKAREKPTAIATPAPVYPNETTKQPVPTVNPAEIAETPKSKAKAEKPSAKRKFRKAELKEDPGPQIRIGGKKMSTGSASKKKRSSLAPKPKQSKTTMKVFVGLAAAVLLGLVLLQTQKQTAELREDDSVAAADANAGDATAGAKYNTPEMKNAIDRINKIIADAQAKAGVTPNPPVSDDIWVKRAYLDVSGAIAPYKNTIGFLYDEDANRRTKVLDDLIESEGYTSHTYNYFADLWRVRTVVEPSLIRMDSFIHWLKLQIHENRPYNELVHEMVVAEGRLWDNPATGWHMRDAATKLDHVAFMTKSLLGTDISCAQCHNDPHDDWQQKHYWEFASFLSELKTKAPGNARGYSSGGKLANALVQREDIRVMMGAENAPRETEEDIIRLRRRANGVNRTYSREIFNPYRVKVHDQKKAMLVLPVNYSYKDGFPGEMVKPHVILGDRERMVFGKTPRQKLARWVTSDKNPWFARNLANHMWYRMFGRAVIEPLHDADSEEADIPELLDALAEEVVNLKFDLKAITWMIVNTDAYQREATRGDVKVTDPYYFQGPLLRRLSSEQLWDSFVTLSVEDPMRYRANPGDDYHAIINLAEDEKKNSVAVEDIIMRSRALNNYKRNQTIIDSRAIKMKESLEDPKKMSASMTKGSGSGGSDSMMGGDSMMMGDSMMAKGSSAGGASTMTNKPGDQMMMTMMGSGRNAKRMVLTRASELNQPADFSHFLHKFGQSERNYQVGAVSKEGSMPQMMELMNGHASAFVASPNSMVFKNVRRTKFASQRASTVFLTVLNRRPSAEEKKVIKDLETNDRGVSDLVWALLNSPEFLFIQ